VQAAPAPRCRRGFPGPPAARPGRSRRGRPLPCRPLLSASPCGRGPCLPAGQSGGEVSEPVPAHPRGVLDVPQHRPVRLALPRRVRRRHDRPHSPPCGAGASWPGVRVRPDHWGTRHLPATGGGLGLLGHLYVLLPPEGDGRRRAAGLWSFRLLAADKAPLRTQTLSPTDGGG
jgi:hypothetical protein